MAEPLDVLRSGPMPTDPDRDFSRGLLARVRDELASQSTRLERAVPATTRRVVDDEVLDEALELLRGTAAEFDPFGRGACIANHAPMTADALCELGRPDAVMERTVRYRKYLVDAPRPWNPIRRDDWRAALGDFDRAGDWVAWFDRELADAPWTEVLDRWVPRLAAGSLASGTHGVLRTAHAARSLRRRHTALRLHELAEGLAFWAARYQTFPESIGLELGLRPSSALAHVEQLDEHRRRHWLLFTEPLENLASVPSFAHVTNLVDVTIDPWEFLDDLTATYARILVTNAALVRARGLVHGLTGGAATRMMLDSLSPPATEISLRYGWQLAAGFYAGLVVEPPADTVDDVQVDVETLIDDAVACGDEHAIKTVELCLDAYARQHDRVHLVAARETTAALLRSGLSLP
jgi:hypothetical protein